MTSRDIPNGRFYIYKFRNDNVKQSIYTRMNGDTIAHSFSNNGISFSNVKCTIMPLPAKLMRVK